MCFEFAVWTDSTHWTCAWHLSAAALPCLTALIRKYIQFVRVLLSFIPFNICEDCFPVLRFVCLYRRVTDSDVRGIPNNLVPWPGCHANTTYAVIYQQRKNVIRVSNSNTSAYCSVLLQMCLELGVRTDSSHGAGFFRRLFFVMIADCFSVLRLVRLYLRVTGTTSL